MSDMLETLYSSMLHSRSRFRILHHNHNITEAVELILKVDDNDR